MQYEFVPETINVSIPPPPSTFNLCENSILVLDLHYSLSSPSKFLIIIVNRYVPWQAYDLTIPVLSPNVS